VNGNHPIHRRLLAEDLTRLRRSDEHRRYAAAQRRGRIDPNPHQIDAVVFALRRIPEMEAYGVRVSVIALKDIILPGDIRDILNQVVTAEKQAQANLIRRREETAATRSRWRRSP